ncbi:hypothetical protein Esti_006821 [Eimeria stiedai]
MRYLTYDLELLEIVRAPERWRHFLIATEHLNIAYQPGATNVVADALSRCPVYEQDAQHASFKVLSVSSLPPTTSQQSCIPASNAPEPAVRASLFILRAQVGRLPRLQPEFNTNSGPPHKSSCSLTTRTHHRSLPSVTLRCKALATRRGRRHYNVAANSHHDLPTVDHLGIAKTYNPIAMKLHWKGIRDGDGCDTILTAVDSLSKMAHFSPTKSSLCTADFVRLFADHVVRYHGLPTTIVSDRDPRFVSEFWRLFCRHFGIKRALPSAWHPQTDGQTERANRTIEQMLRTYTENREEEWPDLRPALELGYSCNCHSATGLSPFEVMLGENPLRRLPQDIDLVDVFPQLSRLQ